MTPEPFVDADVVAAHLKITHRQTLEMTRLGLIPGYPLGTGTSRKVWRYKLSEIDAVVTGGSEKSPEAAFPQNAASDRIVRGSPRSRKGKL